MSEKPFDEEKIREMEAYIERKRKVGKAPLFIIGAGVSVGKVPLMNNIFEYFAKENKKEFLREVDKEIKTIRKYAQRLHKNKKYQTVATSAHLFNLLQNSKNENVRDLWEEFTRDFLMGKIGRKHEEEFIPLWNQNPSDFHLYVAKQVVREHLPAFCMSLNYDGLTAKAIATINNPEKELDKLYPCRILSTPKEIEDFWSSNPKSGTPNEYPIIKLKGDIFYATCTNERCEFHTRPIPSYEFFRMKEIYQEGGLICPECGNVMKLEIDFPGYQKKESHTRDLIKRIYRYIVPSLSCIVVCGVSGKWDNEIVEFLRFCANGRNLDIYCLSHREKGTPALRYMLADLEESKFKHVYIDFQKWLGLEREESKIKEHSINTVNEYICCDDHFWLKESTFEVSIHPEKNSAWLENIDAQKLERTLRFDKYRYPSEGNDPVTRGFLRIETYDLMDRVYQLGIKDILLGKRADYHIRKMHALGTRIIGLAYWEAIASFIGVTNFRYMDPKWVNCLEFALLLHDAGHLPFSHLMEEVYGELNWTRISKPVKYRHDENPLEQISEEDKEKLKNILKQFLELEENEIDDYYDFIQDLIAGVSGIPFLDAIVNSAVDADKIDYIFRDMEYTGKKTRLLDKEDWLNNFLSNISLSPEGLIRLNGEAALRVLELLKERQFLYEELYLRPDIRTIEKIASTIIITWLTSRISKRIKEDFLEKKASDDDLRRYKDNPDLLRYKGEKAYELLLKKFGHEMNEFGLLEELCNDLENDSDYFISDKAREWFSTLNERLKKIYDKYEELKGKEREEEVKKELKRQFTDMVMKGPFYIPVEKTDEAKEIARQLYIDHPCGVLIDIVKFPEFLPSSRARRFNDAIGECFLVPDEDPGKWTKDSIGRVPLHECDFKEFKKPFAQVIIIDTVPEEGKGQFIYDLFKERCHSKEINIRYKI